MCMTMHPEPLGFVWPENEYNDGGALCYTCVARYAKAFGHPLERVTLGMEPVRTSDLANDCMDCGDRFAGPIYVGELMDAGHVFTGPDL